MGLYTNLEKIIPISYKTNKGIAIKDCVIISGGVKIAAKINIKTIACFLFLDKKYGVTMPILVRKRLAKGNSKTRPKANVNIPTKEIYLLTVIMGRIWSVANPRRNFMPMGTMIEYPKTAPKPKKIKDNGPNSSVYFLSFTFSPAEINLQT